MRSYNKLTVALLGAATLLLAGCASVPMASPDLDAAAKRFEAPTDKAAIYVFRDETMGAAITMSVFLDEKLVGKTGAKTYYRIEGAPGSHTLRGDAENDSVLQLDARAGQTYFVWQEVKMGVMIARNKLQIVDASRGQAGVRKCKLALGAE